MKNEHTPFTPTQTPSKKEKAEILSELINWID